MGWITGFVTNLLGLNTPEEAKAILIAIVTLIVGIIFIILVIVLAYKARKRALKRRMEEAESPYVKEIRKLKRRTKNSQERLRALNKIAKNFFKEYLETRAEMTYGEIADKLREKGKNAIAGFCHELGYYLYSGRELSDKETDILIRKFENIVQGKKISVNQTKPEEVKEEKSKKQIKIKKEEKKAVIPKLKKKIHKIKNKPKKIKKIAKKRKKKKK